MQKGSVTIYMSLILAVLLSLFLTLIEGSRKNAIMVEAECAFDLSVHSVFAEYNRQLFDKYDLLFVDTGYGKDSDSLAETKNHFSEYMNKNLSGSCDKNNAKINDVTKTFLENSTILSVSYATDENAKVYERQAIAYMKEKYGIACVEKLANNLEQYTENAADNDIETWRNQNQSIIDNTEIPDKETGEVDANGDPVLEEVELENPADQVNFSRNKGILLLVADMDRLSTKGVDLSNCISNRQIQTKGDGLSGRKDISVADKLLFTAYLTNHFTNYTNADSNNENRQALLYEQEYIIAGKNNDVDNLKAVVHKLLFMRETINVGYLFSDAAKMAEAETLAVSVCTAAGVPVLIEPVKISLLFAWAYAESIYDVKRLLAGEKIPLVKNAENWHYSLEGMLCYEKDISSPASEKGSLDMSQEDLSAGMDYEAYLTLLIGLESENEKVRRSMDLMEMNIRMTDGNNGFCMNHCIDRMKIRASVGSRFGYAREMEREFYYY